MFQKSFIAVSILTAITAQSTFASSTLYCAVRNEASKASTKIELTLHQGMAPIELGNGKTLDISLFQGDIRFMEMRKPTAKEFEANRKPSGKNESALMGIIVGYSQVRAPAAVTLAIFRTEDVSVNCSSVKPDLETPASSSTDEARAQGAE